MASNSPFSTRLINSKLYLVLSLIFILFYFHQFSLVSSFEFQVGEKSGWVVPPANETKVYNDWASEKRFKVGDTIRFKYRKDSVMEVSESEYKKCNSTRPSFFSNTGNTIFALNRSGYFYFISGASGHCDRGQRMIVKVMAQDQDSTASSAASSSGRGVDHHVLAHQLLTLGSIQFLLLFLASHVF